MKTNKELLDFYGVEIGKRYKITGQSLKRQCDWIGRMFVVETNQGFLEIKFDQIPKSQDINALDDYVYEEVKEILTNNEKDYLRAVIKPFRDSIITIEKLEFLDKKACIQIEYRCYDGAEDRTYMPMFNINDLYLGMEKNKKYTLEELGL